MYRIASSTAPAAVPAHSILVGNIDDQTITDWAAQIPIVIAPRRSHEWEWTLHLPDGSESKFRLATVAGGIQETLPEADMPGGRETEVETVRALLTALLHPCVSSYSGTV